MQKDYETTSPRIYVNRRTPSCLLFNFPDSDVQDRSASLRFSNKSTADARKARAVRKAAPPCDNFPCAKVRNNSEILSNNGKNVLFSHEHSHTVQHENLTLTSLANLVTIQQLELSCTFVMVVLDADASFPFLDFA